MQQLKIVQINCFTAILTYLQHHGLQETTSYPLLIPLCIPSAMRMCKADEFGAGIFRPQFDRLSKFGPRLVRPEVVSRSPSQARITFEVKAG